jgi:4-amino-4-deoxy-L-arabinose transferase-like glycosyltransferase
LQAGAFKLFGAGIAQARLVTLASALGVLWIVAWLSWRWYGQLAAAIAPLLLVLWRGDLADFSIGLPLITVGRTGRYDMTGVAFCWLAIALLDRYLRKPGSLVAFALGLAAGLATLTQFFGGFALPLIAGMLLWRDGWRTLRDSRTWSVAAGVLLVVAPYAGYAALHWSDFTGQASLKTGRTDFLDPSFYIANLLDEPRRYEHLIRESTGFDQPIGPLLLALVFIPALSYIGYRARNPDATGDRLLLASVAALALQLALLDSTNATLYTIVLWPAVALVVAAAASDLLTWAWSTRRAWRGQLVGFATALTLLVVVLEGGRAWWIDHQGAASESRYEDFARQLDSHLPAGAPVLGHEHWWWALHDHPYLALNGLNEQWLAARRASQPVTFAELVARTPTRYIVLDPAGSGEAARYSPELAAEMAEYLLRSSILEAHLIDRTYGSIDIYRVVTGDGRVVPGRDAWGDGTPITRHPSPVTQRAQPATEAAHVKGRGQNPARPHW